MNGAPWPAPAKLNLFLHVVGRRSDGYHLLQTVFQFIDLSDDLYVTPRTDGVITLTGGAPDVPPEQDLTVRAARALRSAAGAAGLGADLHLVKRIPLGGGLGGGSSDAATTLVALDALWGLDLGVDELAAIGLSLGADVPVFVRGHAAFAEGVGELLTPIEPAEPWYVLLRPACHVSTAAVFGSPRLTRSTPPITIRGFFEGGVRNDCEPVVREAHPAVADALDWLSAFAMARLTGTGACVYAAFGDRDRAAEVAVEARGRFEAWVVRGCNRSPLLARLAAETSSRRAVPADADNWGVAKR